MSIDFTGEGDETTLTLTHEGFPDENMRDEHQGGWVECLDNLGAYLGDRGEELFLGDNYIKGGVSISFEMMSPPCQFTVIPAHAGIQSGRARKYAGMRRTGEGGRIPRTRVLSSVLDSGMRRNDEQKRTPDRSRPVPTAPQLNFTCRGGPVCPPHRRYVMRSSLQPTDTIVDRNYCAQREVTDRADTQVRPYETTNL